MTPILLALLVAATAPNQYLDPKCNHEVKIVDAAEPQFSKSDFPNDFPNAAADALVVVDVTGRPTSAKIVRSSSNAAIDRATIDAAMHSKYSPEWSMCKPKVGTYLFHVETAPEKH